MSVPWLLQEDWLPKAAAAITERMGRYAASEVKVGLLVCAVLGRAVKS